MHGEEQRGSKQYKEAKKISGEGVCKKKERGVQVGRGSGKPTLFMGGQGSAERNDCTAQGDTTLPHATYVQHWLLYFAHAVLGHHQMHVYTTN